MCVSRAEKSSENVPLGLPFWAIRTFLSSFAPDPTPPLVLGGVRVVSRFHVWRYLLLGVPGWQTREYCSGTFG